MEKRRRKEKLDGRAVNSIMIESPGDRRHLGFKGILVLGSLECRFSGRSVRHHVLFSS